jgi:hypothetical protein
MLITSYTPYYCLLRNTINCVWADLFQYVCYSEFQKWYSPAHPSSVVAEHVNFHDDVMHISSHDACASCFSLS